MAQVIIKGSEKAIQAFCDWFSNSGEQGLMECWADVSSWDPVKMTYGPVKSYLGTEGYGITEPIRLVEYNSETDEEIPYVD
ncbi:hypothetical protein [Serratia phage vB_SspM_LC53]|nr:hypothetical protein [Serratia phage vB_SspM_LC53]